MGICIIKQKQVFNSSEHKDNLDMANALTAIDLEDDLNYIRSAIRSMHGGDAWYDLGDSEIDDAIWEQFLNHIQNPDGHGLRSRMRIPTGGRNLIPYGASNEKNSELWDIPGDNTAQFVQPEMTEESLEGEVSWRFSSSPQRAAINYFVPVNSRKLYQTELWARLSNSHVPSGDTPIISFGVECYSRQRAYLGVRWCAAYQREMIPGLNYRLQGNLNNTGSSNDRFIPGTRFVRLVVQTSHGTIVVDGPEIFLIQEVTQIVPPDIDLPTLPGSTEKELTPVDYDEPESTAVVFDVADDVIYPHVRSIEETFSSTSQKDNSTTAVWVGDGSITSPISGGEPFLFPLTSNTSGLSGWSSASGETISLGGATYNMQTVGGRADVPYSAHQSAFFSLLPGPDTVYPMGNLPASSTEWYGVQALHTATSVGTGEAFRLNSVGLGVLGIPQDQAWKILVEPTFTFNITGIDIGTQTYVATSEDFADAVGGWTPVRRCSIIGDTTAKIPVPSDMIFTSSPGISHLLSGLQGGPSLPGSTVGVRLTSIRFRRFSENITSPNTASGSTGLGSNYNSTHNRLDPSWSHTITPGDTTMFNVNPFFSFVRTPFVKTPNSGSRRTHSINLSSPGVSRVTIPSITPNPVSVSVSLDALGTWVNAQTLQPGNNVQFEINEPTVSDYIRLRFNTSAATTTPSTVTGPITVHPVESGYDSGVAISTGYDTQLPEPVFKDAEDSVTLNSGTVVRSFSFSSNDTEWSSWVTDIDNTSSPLDNPENKKYIRFRYELEPHVSGTTTPSVNFLSMFFKEGDPSVAVSLPIELNEDSAFARYVLTLSQGSKSDVVIELSANNGSDYVVAPEEGEFVGVTTGGMGMVRVTMLSDDVKINKLQVQFVAST